MRTPLISIVFAASVFLVASIPVPAPASPLFEFNCRTNEPVGPLPESIEYLYTIRRHWHNTEPLTEINTEFWGEATYSSGEMEIEVPLIAGGSLQEEATGIDSTLLNGNNGLRDEFEDLATSTTQGTKTDGFWIRDFSLLFRDDQGEAWDTHLSFPESFDLSLFERNTCVIFWRDGRDLSPQCTPHPDCNIGYMRGDITAVTPLPHLHSHDGSVIEINAGMNDAWVSDGAPFQGLFITYYPGLNVIFLAWFTFDTVLPVEDNAVFGASDHRWVTALGVVEGNAASLKAELTTGGQFNTSDPPATQDSDYGTIDLEFSDCENASVSYAFPALSLEGQFDITRAIPREDSICQWLNDS